MIEEVDRILTLYTGKTGIHLDEIKRELSRAGVVIKAARELPQTWYEYVGEITESDLLKAIRQTQADIMEAGYVAVEPFIKEE